MAKILRFNCAMGAVPFGRMQDAIKELKNPDRVAYRTGAGFADGATFQEWPNRHSMARTIRMQESGPARPGMTYKAVVPLGISEGY